MGYISQSSSSAMIGALSSPKTFNIRNYGAKQDGTTDDSAALLAARVAALAAGGSNVVYIPDSTAGTRFLASASNVLSAGDVIIKGDPGGSKILAPRTTSASISGSCINVDFSGDMLGPYTITELVDVVGYEFTSNGSHALTANNTTESVYDSSSWRLDRTSGTQFVWTIDGTTLTAGFDMTIYNFDNGSSGTVLIQGDGVTTVSVDGGSAASGNTVTLQEDTACFVKFVGGVITITTGITAVLNGADVVTRVEMSAADAAHFAFGDRMHIDSDIELDASVSGQRGYESNAETVYGRYLGYVFLTSKLKVALTSATNKFARKYATYKCIFEDIVLVGEGNVDVDSTAGSSKSAVCITGAVRPILKHCGAQDIWNFGWTIRSCISGEFSDIIGRYARNSAEYGAEQYLINYDGLNRYHVLEGVHCEGFRHPFTTTIASSVSAWSGTLSNVMRHGEMSNCTFKKSQINNVMGDGFDTHKTGTNCVVEGWDFQGCIHGHVGTIIPKHIQHRAGAITYRNCTFRDFIDCITIEVDSDGEVRGTANDIIFEDCIFYGSRGANNTTANTQRTVQMAGSTSHTAVQRVVFRNNTFYGDCTRLFDIDGNYQVEIYGNKFLGAVKNSGFLLEMDGDTFSTYTNKLTFYDNYIDTSGYGAAVTGIVRVNGTIDVYLGPNTVKGTNYSAIVAASSNAAINIYKWGQITQLDQRREIVSGTITAITTLDPRVIVNTTAVGNVGGGTDTLMSYSLPARTIQDLGDGVRITAWGTAANNANVKTLKMQFGATAILTTTLTANQVGSWRATATVFNTGSATQDTSASLVEAGTATQIDNEIGTAAIATTAAITISMTGAATTDNDIVQEGWIIEVFKG